MGNRRSDAFVKLGNGAERAASTEGSIATHRAP